MKTTALSSAALRRLPEKERRDPRCRCSSSGRKRSWMGTAPFCSALTLAASLSTKVTSCPNSAKQAPATRPTYPEPTTAIRINLPRPNRSYVGSAKLPCLGASRPASNSSRPGGANPARQAMRYYSSSLGFAAKDKPLAGIFRIMQPWRNTWSRELRDSLDFRECDLLDLDAMRHACQGIDYVLHQAAIASVPRSIADPLNSNRANVDGSLNLLVAARDAQVKRVVFAASSSALLRRITGYQGPVQHGPERRRRHQAFLCRHLPGRETLGLSPQRRLRRRFAAHCSLVSGAVVGSPGRWGLRTRPLSGPDERAAIGQTCYYFGYLRPVPRSAYHPNSYDARIDRGLQRLAGDQC